MSEEKKELTEQEMREAAGGMKTRQAEIDGDKSRLRTRHEDGLKRTVRRADQPEG